MASSMAPNKMGDGAEERAMSEMKNATSSEYRLEGILDQVRVLKAKYDERVKCTGENFNVFSILDRERKEVTTHSAIIAELLNPQGTHSQGTLFLKLFLAQLLRKLQEEPKAQLKELREKLKQIQEENEFDKFEVEVETSKEGKVLGRIDILIESDGIKNGDVCIVIENKIDARDQEEQLGRYYKYASYTKKTRGIIYLTLRGGGPTDYTLYGDEQGKFDKSELDKIKDTVVCLSYKKFIYEWLGACIKDKEVAHCHRIKETLLQYQMTVKKLTGQPINRGYAMALKNILLKDKNYNLIPELETAISEVKDAFQHEFWKELKERLIKEELADQNSKFQLYESDIDTEIPDEELREYIGYNSLDLGLTFGIPNSLPSDRDNNHEVAFRIYYERSLKHSYFTYGFVFCRKRSTEEDTLQRVKIEQEHKEDLERYGISSEDHPEHKNGWISWTSFPCEPEIFITESNEKLIKKLIRKINLALSETRKDNKA